MTLAVLLVPTLARGGAAFLEGAIFGAFNPPTGKTGGEGASEEGSELARRGVVLGGKTMSPAFKGLFQTTPSGNTPA